MAGDVTLSDQTHSMDSHSERIEQGREAGETYINNLEKIREDLSGNEDGASLATMVASQLKMTEVEAQYNVQAGLPKKASSANQAASQDVKKAAG
jgi:ABC-type Zn uptake system ZnuABC Zn-binding protein ZnuA